MHSALIVALTAINLQPYYFSGLMSDMASLESVCVWWWWCSNNDSSFISN